MYTLDKSNQLVSERLRASSVADAWSSSKTYAKNDFASKDGFLYRSKADGNVGHQPADEANWWEKASVIGTNGFSPLDSLAISAYNWKQNVYYGRGEFVFKDGLPYVCIQDGTNGAWDPSKWSTKYLTASGCVVSGELIAGEGVSVSGNGSVNISSGYDIRWKGDGRSIVFDSNGASATLVVDGTKVLTEGTAFPSNVTTYSPSAFSAGTWTWYDGSLGSGTGLYVSKTAKASAAAFSPSDWNKIDTVSSMFSSSNTALIRNVRGKTSESDVKLAKIAGVDVYAPSMARAVVVEASVYGSSEVVTGETVTLYEVAGEARTVVGTKPYDGVPVTFELSGRGLKTYIVDMTNTKLRPSFMPIFFETSSVKYVSAVYGRMPVTFNEMTAALATFPSTTAANVALVGAEIADTWTAEDGTEYADPMICTAVKDYYDANNVPHRGAKMERKYASLHPIEFCTGINPWSNFGTIDATYGADSICVADGRLFVVGAGTGGKDTYTKPVSAVSTSEKASPWTPFGTYGGGFNYAECACVADGRLFAVGYNGSAYTKPVSAASTSEKASPWTSFGTCKYSMMSICVADGRLFAVGSGGSTYTKPVSAVSTSEKASPWTPFGTCGGTYGLYSVCVADGRLFAVGSGADNSYGITYTKTVSAASTSEITSSWTWFGKCYKMLYSVCVEDGRLFAVGYGGSTYTKPVSAASTDEMGNDWVRFGNAGDGGLKSVCVADGLLFAVDWNGCIYTKPVSAASTDEEFYRDWRAYGRARKTTGYDDLRSICAADGKIFAVGDDAYVAPTSARSERGSFSNYRYSTVRQYLNNDSGVGAWHHKEHSEEYQCDPVDYDIIRGYRLGCSAELTSVMHSVAVSTQSCVADGGNVYVTYDSFFLDSVTEKYGVRYESGAVTEGTYDSYWKDATELDSPSNNSNPGRVTYLSGTSMTPKAVYMRSALHRNAEENWYCNSNGGITYCVTTTRKHITPCCVIW